MLAEYFASINGKKVMGITKAFPPHELTENQIALTKAEFDFLHKFNMDEAEILIAAIRAKIEVMK